MYALWQIITDALGHKSLPDFGTTHYDRSSDNFILCFCKYVSIDLIKDGASGAE